MKAKNETIKNKIIKSAISCFFENGFEETTFKQIADKLDVTQPLMYNYFSNKMDLLLACSMASAEDGRQYIDAKVDQRQSAAKRLDQYIIANFDWFSKEEAKGFSILSVYYFAATHDDVKNFFEYITISAIERIEILLHQIQNEEKIKLKNINVVARMIHNILVGELFKSQLSNPKLKISHEDILASIKKLIKQ